MSTRDQIKTGSIPLPDNAPVRRNNASEDIPFWLKSAVVGFVFVFALLLAMFPARNSELLFHLASGRALISGRVPAATIALFNAEPRASQFLLYDLLAYGVYSVVGGAGLVLAKALLVAATALIMLRLSRFGSFWWTAAACTTLALLAMSIRLLLQPATVSCFMLALSLLLAQPRNMLDTGSRHSLFPRWPLMVLFLIWANLDSWFVVGLAVIGLIWFGEIADRWRLEKDWPRLLGRRAAGLVLLAAVCLINPVHFHAFALPPDLAGLIQPSETVKSLAVKQVISPFQEIYYDSISRSPAGLAYYPLLALGMISFLLNRRGWHWQRFLPWLGLAAVSAMQVRAAPFFAVVGGPILACNLQDYLTRREQAIRRPRREWPLARLSSGLAALVLIGCAWPGWLQLPPYEPRRFAIELPPSFEAVAATVNQWRSEQQLKSSTRWLYLSPEIAAAFAWHCPGEPGVFDARLASEVRTGSNTAELSGQLRAAGITHAVLYDPDSGRLFAALENLLADSSPWSLFHLEGNVLIFGWHDPENRQAGDSSIPGRFEPDAVAFGAPDEVKKAPASPIEQAPPNRRWWEAFWKRAPRRSIGSEEATLLLFQAEALRRNAPQRLAARWQESLSAALIGAPTAWHLPQALFDARVRLSLLQPQAVESGASSPAGLSVPDRAGLIMQRKFTLQQDDTPPAFLYLAVRSARCAVASNPLDAQAYQALGECYLRLLHSTRERVWGGVLPELVELRRAQASAALNRAIQLNPNLPQAHLSLSSLYRELGYLDLTLKHLKAYSEIVHRSNDQAPEALREQQAAYEKETDRLTKLLDKQLKNYLGGVAKSKLIDRTKAAEGMGLAETARDNLLESDISAFGAEGMVLELKLLIKTGRCRDVCDWMLPEHEAIIGFDAYHWLRAQAQAACGNYLESELECDRLASSAVYESSGSQAVDSKQVIAMLIGQTILDDSSIAPSIPFLADRAFRRTTFFDQLGSLVSGMRKKADWTVIRGLLALEEGDVFEARFAFRTALAIWKDEAAARSGAGLDFRARPMAQAYLKLLDAAAPPR